MYVSGIGFETSGDETEAMTVEDKKVAAICTNVVVRLEVLSSLVLL